MWYLILQIILCLLAAFLLGALLVWWIYRSVAARRERELNERLSRVEKDLANASAQYASEHDRVGQLDGQLTAQTAETRRVADELAAKAVAFSDLEGRHANVQASLKQTEDRAAQLGKETESLSSGLTDSEWRIGELKNELSRVSKAKDAEIDQLGERVHQLEPLTQVVADRDGRIRELEMTAARIPDLEQSLRDRDTALGELEDDRAKLDNLSSQLEARESQIRRLEGDLKTQGDREAQWNRSIEQARTRIGEFEHTVAERDARIGDLELLRGELQNRTAELARERVEFRATVQRKDAEIEELKRRTPAPVAAEPPPRVIPIPAPAPVRPVAKDDLKRIKGIGKVLENLLHQNGIYTFSEIANWTPEDVERIDRKLETFRGRITRDDWIRQAREIQQYGD